MARSGYSGSSALATRRVGVSKALCEPVAPPSSSSQALVHQPWRLPQPTQARGQPLASTPHCCLPELRPQPIHAALLALVALVLASHQGEPIQLPGFDPHILPDVQTSAQLDHPLTRRRWPSWVTHEGGNEPPRASWSTRLSSRRGFCG